MSIETVLTMKLFAVLISSGGSVQAFKYQGDSKKHKEDKTDTLPSLCFIMKTKLQLDNISPVKVAALQAVD